MDLTTRYLGLELKHPLVPSPSPLSGNIDRMCQLEDAGAPAIVMFSLFEEEIIQEELTFDHFMDFGAESFMEATRYMPNLPEYTSGTERYLELIADAKRRLDIPVIASLNCHTEGRWLEYASQIEEAGADAIELNLYDLTTNPEQSSTTVEHKYLSIIREVRANTELPIAVKLHPFFTSLPNIAGGMVEAGAQGLVLFNRFYQPDIDIEHFDVTPKLVLSQPTEFLLPLRWTAILSGQIDADFAITTGLHSSDELVKALMVGANVGMVASELLANGLQRIEEIVAGLREWMERHEYDAVSTLQGCMNFNHVQKPEEYVRSNYLRVLKSYSFDPTGKAPHL
jgi:dihydroorotate dehydrogenase (fumarate)